MHVIILIFSLINLKIKTVKNIALINAWCCFTCTVALKDKLLVFFYKPVNKLQTIFVLCKDPFQPDNMCGVVYEIPNVTNKKYLHILVYIGQTGNSHQTRLQQHRAACHLLQPEKSAVAQHTIDEAKWIDWAEAKVVERATDWRQQLFKEAFVTRCVRVVVIL